MTRLIDADQFGVVSFQGKSEEFIEGVAFILEKIDNAPTVEERPHGEWIPCSERLPKRNELVLASFATGVDLCEYVADRTSDEWFSLTENCYVWNELVKAWMPLPEPYKGEGEKNEYDN